MTDDKEAELRIRNLESGNVLNLASFVNFCLKSVLAFCARPHPHPKHLV